MHRRWWAYGLVALGLLCCAVVAWWVWQARDDRVGLLDRSTIGGFVLAELGAILATIGIVFAAQDQAQRRRIRALAKSGGDAAAAGGDIGDVLRSREGVGDPLATVDAKATGKDSRARAAGGSVNEKP